MAECEVLCLGGSVDFVVYVLLNLFWCMLIRLEEFVVGYRVILLGVGFFFFLSVVLWICLMFNFGERGNLCKREVVSSCVIVSEEGLFCIV